MPGSPTTASSHSHNYGYRHSASKTGTSVQRLTTTIGVPNTTRVMGMCGGGVATTQSISPMFYGDWILNFIFSHALSDYSPRRPLLLDDAIVQDPRVPVGTSYMCQPPTIVDVQGIMTRMTSFQYLAFGNQTTSSFDPKKMTDCPALTPFATDDNDHTGTIVGVVIAVFFTIMVLVGIYIYRRRGKVSYEQVY
uniref:Lysosome-associated membrane glycoprotein 1 n=1 Tax=Magallana gigas TaxID=29159 RepID=A0A8W8ISU4_MAGGI